jgi:hypothetical protein
MSRRTLPLLFTAFLMLTGFLLPALRVAACLTSGTEMPAGCPMKAAANKPKQASTTAEKHGCCRETSPKPETKVLTGTCCCTIKAAAKPVVRDYRTAFNVVDIVCCSDERFELAGPFVITASNTNRCMVDVHISRGPPRGAPPHRGPPTLS